jgi:hypothetical protein
LPNRGRDAELGVERGPCFLALGESSQRREVDEPVFGLGDERGFRRCQVDATELFDGDLGPPREHHEAMDDDQRRRTGDQRSLWTVSLRSSRIAAIPPKVQSASHARRNPPMASAGPSGRTSPAPFGGLL